MSKKTNTTERWKKIEEYPRYEISSMGRVRSYTNPKKPRILRPHQIRSGYLMVHLAKGTERTKNETECVRVHKLVADAFIPNPYNRCHIRHINQDKTDNRVENLRWVTPEESANDPLTKQHMREALPQRLEKVSKPVLVYDENLTLLSAFTSTAETARQLKLHQGNIVNVCSGSLRHYKHLIFSYTPINSQEDRDRQLKDGEEKYKRRLQLIQKALKKSYYKDIEKSRERGRLIMRQRAKDGKTKPKQNTRGKTETQEGVLPKE